MPTLDILQRQITTVKKLQSVVKTMKVLAAVSIRQYEQAVESLAEYTRTIEMGLQVVLKDHDQELLPLNITASQSKQQIIAIAFGSDQGMCGQFNEQIAQYAIAHLTKMTTKPMILTVGTRIITPLENAGQIINSSFSMPSTLAGIVPTVQDLLLQIDQWRSQTQITEIVLFYNQPRSNTFFETQTFQLFPLDQNWLKELQQKKWESRTLPIFTMDRDKLFSSLIQQYFFIWIYHALAASLASENASRLSSMQLAQKNIEERLITFNDQFQQERQAAITEEILEIVSGSEALK